MDGCGKGSRIPPGSIFGWSYGGYAALQAVATEPDLYRAAIAVAPVTDLEALRSDARNYSHFLMVSDFIGTGPHVREGSPAQNTAQIKAPVLMFHGDKDINVAIRQSRLMADRLRSAGSRRRWWSIPSLTTSSTIRRHERICSERATRSARRQGLPTK